MSTRALAGLMLAMAVLPAGKAWAQAVPAAAPAPGLGTEFYLEVAVNGESSGKVLRFTQGPRGLRSTAQNLRDVDLDPAMFGLGGQEEFDLAAARGLAHRYDPAAQTLDLTVAAELRAATSIAARPIRELATAAGASRGALLNYQLYAQAGRGGRTSGMHELRLFDGNGVFSSSGIATLRGVGRTYTRLDSWWTRSDPVNLETVQVGDFVSNALPWSRSLRMGGIQYRKNFDLRPDLLTYPVAALSGTAVVPTAVSLYVNGMQQLTTEVPSGPFTIGQIAGLNGAGQASIVTRDALGRTVSTTLPLYVDTRLMAKDLTDFSVEAGVLRRDYGLRSFSYAHTPSFSASARRGITDTWTVEGHAEAGRGLVNLGGGSLLRLGNIGVVNGSLAASAGRSRGVQGSVGYQYISSRFSVDAQTVRASRRYADLASGEGTPPATRTDRVSLNLALPLGQTAGISYVAYQVPGQDPGRIAALAWSAALPRGTYASLSAFKDLDKPAARGLSFSLSMSFGERTSASATAGRQQGLRNRNLSLVRSADYGGGFGWALQGGGVEENRYAQAQVQYLGSAGQATLIGQRNGDVNALALDASGALVIMDGTFAPARQVGAGFALVSTGLPDVPVVHENRPLGRTNGGGYLLVPNLIPFTNNQLSIDTTELPVDVRVPSTSLTAVPQRLAGVLVRFPVEKYVAATVILRGTDGKPLPVGTPVHDPASGRTTLVGYDGMVFVEDLQENNRLQVGSGAAACEVRFTIKPEQGALPTIGPLVCRPAGNPP
ncbi:outer membrane usher protein [Pseudoduganella lurida]|uniref:Outer membrane usher protein n=1 Tax=Pseudoduganella lurida TaxID=1036180 RepID=A0A562RFU6_9BURK|nr:fimbria/pilus outer membrane usher protein [Pseudoduganella lurida]TWI67300.1 outer membrane usher protein [Pseudoduganella lurida]